MNMEDLSFQNGNPGSVRVGNYINYYTFHSVERRIEGLSKLPSEVWNPGTNGSMKHKSFFALDLGCNRGDLTIAIQEFLKKKTKEDWYMLGIDIDPLLTAEAMQNNEYQKIKFFCLDFMDRSKHHKILDYLEQRNSARFHVVFCFSITMWIHLNHGDEGLRMFLKDVAALGELVVIEAQPWNCYPKAVKRLKKAFPLYHQLQWRKDIESHIEEYMVQECNCEKVTETPRLQWNRKIMIFKSNSMSS